MKIKAKYPTLDDVPEEYRDLYEERGGEYVLTQIEGLRTDADITRVQNALTAEKTAHKKSKDTLAALLGGRTAEEVQADLDRIPELEASAGNVDEAKIEALVTARVKRETAPLERRVRDAEAKAAELEGENTTLKASEKKRKVHDALRQAGTKAKITDTAMEDLLMYDGMFDISEDGKIVTRDGVGAAPGIEPETWLQDMQEKRPHWWPPSQGGGAGGGKTTTSFPNNPWSAEHWNMTEQAKVIQADRPKAERMAAAAQSKIGATAPTVKK